MKEVMTATNDFVLVQLHKQLEKKSGSLIIPTDGIRRGMDRGVIISVGPLAFKNYEKYYDLPVPEMQGKEILFEIAPATQMYFDRRTVDGNEYKIIRDSDITCLITLEEEVKE